jgi:hypothetical protein
VSTDSSRSNGSGAAPFRYPCLAHSRSRSGAEIGLDDARVIGDLVERALGDLDAMVERDDPVRMPTTCMSFSITRT